EMSAAGILEHGDFFLRAAAGYRAGNERVEVAQHVALPDRTACDRAQDVADALERRLAAIDEDARASRRFVVGFARLRRGAADQVEVRAGLQVDALYQRLVRACASTDDVGGARGGIEVIDRFDVHAFTRQRLGDFDGARKRAVPDRHATQRGTDR